MVVVCVKEVEPRSSDPERGSLARSRSSDHDPRSGSSEVWLRLALHRSVTFLFGSGVLPKAFPCLEDASLAHFERQRCKLSRRITGSVICSVDGCHLMPVALLGGG